MIESAELRRGRVSNIGTARVAVHFLSNPALDGQPARVELVVLPRGGDEQRVTLHQGDDFAVGSDVWRLAGIDGVGTHEYVVRIVRVEAR